MVELLSIMAREGYNVVIVRQSATLRSTTQSPRDAFQEYEFILDVFARLPPTASMNELYDHILPYIRNRDVTIGPDSRISLLLYELKETLQPDINWNRKTKGEMSAWVNNLSSQVIGRACSLPRGGETLQQANITRPTYSCSLLRDASASAGANDH
ncbi:hypothetical protein QCA50_016750 [Cerrena zonata]|uniref:Uncharacterized protein n=1 Tax=Cerrena zonata TaxID=2478898 RepID=A0AAW0FI35_9APHY